MPDADGQGIRWVLCHQCQTLEKERKSDMTLVQVQKILGDRIEISLQENKTPEQRQEDNEQSALIMNIAKQMINNGDLILRIEKLASQTRNLKKIVSYEMIGAEQ